jgi:hypothetical protein
MVRGAVVLRICNTLASCTDWEVPVSLSAVTLAAEHEPVFG